MLEGNALDMALAAFNKRMQDINTRYIRMMAEHIKQIGELTASDVNRLQNMQILSQNMVAIREDIRQAAQISDSELRDILTKVVNLEGSTRIQSLIGDNPISLDFGTNAHLMRALESQMRVTKNALQNYSNTTVVSTQYQKLVDSAITAIQTGTTSFNTEIRSSVRNAVAHGCEVREINADGMRLKPGEDKAGETNVVRYASGLTRRLDTAMRQNIIDGARELNQTAMNIVGEEVGADGFEISAHMLCADDHIDVQGKQFRAETFEDDTMKHIHSNRHIGTWNCKHIKFPILYGKTPTAYRPRELKAMREYSTEQIEINGVKLTRYQWSQEMRKIETKVRQQKDIAIFSETSGDRYLYADSQIRIEALQNQYVDIANKTGLEAEYTRMYVDNRPVERIATEAEKPATEPPQTVQDNTPHKTYYTADGALVDAETGEVLRDADPNETICQGLRILNNSTIEYNPVLESDPRTEDDIISALCGGDRTTGSCASLALAYTGCKQDLDVLDFRGGQSQKWFSENFWQQINRLDGVVRNEKSGRSQTKDSIKLMGGMVPGKEYLLCTGGHAAIVRVGANGGYEYLELQSGWKNGFISFGTTQKEMETTLHNRFAAVYNSNRYVRRNTLIDCESLGQHKDFRRILGYINTESDKQQKGAGGHER